MIKDRYQELLNFLQEHQLQVSSCNPCDCGNQCALSLQPLSGDASFRRYYRLQLPQEKQQELFKQSGFKPLVPFTATKNSDSVSVIVVDAPPATQKNREFVAINTLLRHSGLNVPTILCADVKNGFMVQEDLGNTLFITPSSDTEERLAFYFRASMELTKIGAIPLSAETIEFVTISGSDYKLTAADFETLKSLPPFDDAFIRMELGIFMEWCVDKALHLNLTDGEQKIFNEAFTFLSEECRRQTQVAMHRDFHSRNIMVLPDGCDSAIQAKLALLDYQDMVLGPIGYDVASLVFDCYTVLEPQHRELLISQCYENYKVAHTIDPEKVSLEQFTQDVLVCAIQRHIKCLGIFNRLHLRDGKDGYLKHLPQTLRYVLENCRKVPEMIAFGKILEQRLRIYLS